MNLEVDVKEIKNLLSELNKKIEMLIENRETHSLMLLTEKSMKEFLMNEPELYSIDDITVRYHFFPERVLPCLTSALFIVSTGLLMPVYCTATTQTC